MERRVAAVALSVALLAAGASTAAPAGPDVKLGHSFALTDGGQAVTGTVRASCPVGTEVLEALVTVSQEDAGASGQGGIPPFPCDGKKHKLTVVVRSEDGPFRRGTAFASAFVLVIDESGSTQQAQDSHTVRVH